MLWVAIKIYLCLILIIQAVIIRLEVLVFHQLSAENFEALFYLLIIFAEVNRLTSLIVVTTLF
jgi:hypothetical protein